VPGTATVTRAWADKAALDSADDFVWAGATELSLAAKGWTRSRDEGGATAGRVRPAYLLNRAIGARSRLASSETGEAVPVA
jgi:hypothetical protein